MDPRRGEIWRVNLEPAQGSEIRSFKSSPLDTRPVLVLTRAGIGTPGVLICVPITDFKPQRDARRFWRVVIGEGQTSGLTKISCADVSQVRALDISRFTNLSGRAHPVELEAAAVALGKCVGY